jgi:hypothetical protein
MSRSGFDLEKHRLKGRGIRSETEKSLLSLGFLLIVALPKRRTLNAEYYRDNIFAALTQLQPQEMLQLRASTARGTIGPDSTPTEAAQAPRARPRGGGEAQKRHNIERSNWNNKALYLHYRFEKRILRHLIRIRVGFNIREACSLGQSQSDGSKARSDWAERVGWKPGDKERVN